MRRRSVYNHSYKPFECAQHIYQENLSFRLHKRLTQLSHQPFDWPDDTDSSSSPERVLCGEHARTRGAPTYPLSTPPPTGSDSPPCHKDSSSTVKRDESIQAGTAMITSVYTSPMSPSQNNLYFPAGSGWLRNYKDCVAKNTIPAEDSSLCASKNVGANKCDLKTTPVDGRNSVDPSTQVCSASKRDRAVENALITSCKVNGLAANASVVTHENKTPISEVVTSSDLSYKPKVRCSVALSSGHSSGRHSYRPSASADSHVGAAYNDEPSHSTRVCVYRCSRNPCQNHCHQPH
ncbi:unnamed protein product [Taenia asiatica]|uniref:C2H2-type domain-containing protein n=1 Tax=Taenia asiatica TaxID=60517 RepID=A0A0R3W8B7_TAEAS|nr:unnamed protein product [Taenia asiatica]